jgi:hypothetical protein
VCLFKSRVKERHTKIMNGRHVSWRKKGVVKT